MSFDAGNLDAVRVNAKTWILVGVSGIDLTMQSKRIDTMDRQ